MKQSSITRHGLSIGLTAFSSADFAPLDEREACQMIRDVGLRGKFTWLLALVHEKRIPQRHIKAVLQVCDLRNEFVHHKYKMVDVDSHDESARFKEAHRSAEKTARYLQNQLKASSEVHRSVDYNPPGNFGGECLTVYYNRLQRDGWVMRDKEYQGATLFEKQLPKSWLLRKLAFAEIGAPPGRGCYWDAHELRHESTNTVLVFPEWEWADFVDGRLVFAVAGKLCAARLGRGKLLGEKLLHDFNGMKFKAIAAPY